MNGWMDGCLGLAGFGGEKLRGVRSLRRHFELEGEAAAAADLKVEGGVEVRHAECTRREGWRNSKDRGKEEA